MQLKEGGGPQEKKWTGMQDQKVKAIWRKRKELPEGSGGKHEKKGVKGGIGKKD